jgi:hypothetical protein
MRQIGVLFAIVLLTEASLFGQARDAAPPSTSAALATELVALLEARSLDSMAAPDPAHEGRYVAVLVYPKVQILAIGGNYSVPQLMNERLLRKEYRDAYVELNRAADGDGRFFVQDLAADGLHALPEPGGSPDVVYRDAATSTIFTGDWKARSMTGGLPRGVHACGCRVRGFVADRHRTAETLIAETAVGDAPVNSSVPTARPEARATASS